MEPAAYAEHAAFERWHWWFVGRRAVLRSLLTPLENELGGGRVLAVGCGYGAELDFLSSYGRITGTEIEMAPLRSALGAGVRGGAAALAGSLPFASSTFRVVAMFDVLEHVREESDALHEVHRVLEPGGYLVMTVPALPWLWSAWDERVHHQRRYTARSLESALHRSGFATVRLTYFNTVLLPVVAALRRLDGLRRSAVPADGNEFALGSRGWINAGLTAVLRAEALWVRSRRLPVGVSLAAIGRCGAELRRR